MRKQLIASILMLTACGQTDFDRGLGAVDPAHGVSRIEDRLSLDGAKSIHTQGLLLRLSNAVAYPDGANHEPTRCHLYARLCALPPVAAAVPLDETASSHAPQEAPQPTREQPICLMLGIVNAAETETYHIEASALEDALRWPLRQVQVELQSSCQVTSLYYPAGPAVCLHADISTHAQTLDIEVTKANWASYEAHYHDVTP